MFSKVISNCQENSQQYRDNLYQKLHTFFQDDFSSIRKDNITDSGFNIYFKKQVLQFIGAESSHSYENVAKNDFPFEILLRRTALIDSVIKFSLECAVLQFNRNNKTSFKPENLPFVLIARGGYGRREMFPLSDIDLIAISHYPSNSEEEVKKIIHNFEYLFIHQNIFPTPSSFSYLKLDDIGMPIPRNDIINFRSLLEGRFVTGNEKIYNLFYEKIHAILEANKKLMIKDNIVHAKSYAIEDTVFQQEPDVKNDIRRLYWALFLAKIKFGYKESSMVDILNRLFSENKITEQVHNRDQIALSFLIKVRILLHLIHPSSNKDRLSFETRERISKTMGFEINDFYKEYFYHAALPLKRDAGKLFWHCMSLDEKVVRKISEDFGESSSHTIVFRPGKETLFSTAPEKIFNVMKLVARKGYNISYPVILSIEKHIDHLVPVFTNNETKKNITKTFQKILKGKYFAKAIRDLHEFGLISNFIIPEFSSLCGLPQDIYVHRFPVDIHILAALDALNKLELDQGDPFLVRLYQNQKNNKLLKIATLLHDIGKGYKIEFRSEDEVGESMVPSILKELGITDKKNIDTICFLVGKHLAMKDLLDLDPYDDETYELIWKLIDRDMGKLRMLILLTFADRDGSKMKMSSGQIARLKYIYQRALYFEKKETVDESLKLEFIDLIELPPDIQVQLDTYNIYKQSKDLFAVELYYVENKPTQLILCLEDQPGILYRIACIMAFNKLSIINAQVNTRGKTALDIFKLTDANGKPIDYSNYYYIQRCLKEDIEKVFVKGSLVSDRYKNKILVGSDKEKKYKGITLKIRIIGRAIKIVTPDMLGIFMQTTKTFASMHIPIFRAIMHCRNNYANNIFYLREEDIKKINHNMEGFSKRLSEEINKLIAPGPVFS